MYDMFFLFVILSVLQLFATYFGAGIIITFPDDRTIIYVNCVIIVDPENTNIY